MTMFPTAEQTAASEREIAEISLRGLRTRITLLEKLIKSYAVHIDDCEGVTFLENHYYYSGSFTCEEWAEIRRIAGVTN